MKAKQIKKLRKKILSPGYDEDRLYYWLRTSEALETFQKFKCSEFFVGYAVANHNQELYERDRPRVNARIRWYQRKLGHYRFIW